MGFIPTKASILSKQQIVLRTFDSGVFKSSLVHELSHEFCWNRYIPITYLIKVKRFGMFSCTNIIENVCIDDFAFWSSDGQLLIAYFCKVKSFKSIKKLGTKLNHYNIFAILICNFPICLTLRRSSEL